jgi:predicted MFS family arabinose efflux permease
MGDGGFTVYEINQVSLRQALAPERLLGRVNASMRFVAQGALLLGSLTGGLLGELIGLRTTLVMGACGALIAALWPALSPVRSVRWTDASVREEPVPV